MFEKAFHVCAKALGFCSASAGPVKAFLDKEKRPGAEVVTESFVSFKTNADEISVEGVLGAIASDKNPGTYVAFSGVEISIEQFVNGGDDLSSLKFNIKDKDQIQTLSVQLVLKNGDLFARDLEMDKFSVEEFKLPLDSFKDSYRGRIGNDSFNGKIEQLNSVRFYLKRSENIPKSKEALYYKFKLKTQLAHIKEPK